MMGLGVVDLWVGERNKNTESEWVLGLHWEGSCFVMELGAVDLWVGERNKNTEFGMGPWTAVGRKLLCDGIGCC